MLAYCEYRMFAQHTALDRGSNRRRHYNPRQHRLIEIADYFFDRERPRGDWSIESRRDSCCCANGKKATQIVSGQSRAASECAGYARTDLNSWSFSSQRRAGTNLKYANDKFSYRIDERHATTTDRVSDFHLWDAAAACIRHDKLK